MAEDVIYSALEAQKRIDALPQEVKDVLYSTEMLSTIRNIGEKNKLHIDQIGLLQAETSSVMLGFTASSDFVASLIGALGVDQAIATDVAKDVDEMLFSKIRDAMKSVYEANKSPTPIEAVPAAVVSPPPAVTPKAPLSSLLPTSSTPIATVPPSPVTPTVPTPPKPQTETPKIGLADSMLTQKTIQVPPPPTGQVKPPINPATDIKSTPPAPAPYKSDPYREPVE